MNRATLQVLCVVTAVLGHLCLPAAAARASTWFPLGPYGGDARSFASDPRDSRHLYLGTLTGWVYESRDGGTTWKRLSQIEHRDDLVIKQIVADPGDPRRLIVAAYAVDRPDGGLFISEDSGKNWYGQAQMHGQSVRSLARSVSSPNQLVAGTLEGVFQSKDNGKHWGQISPEGSTELHEIESIAIDPVNPDVIYVGTWHLPWKTTDGGKTWENIKRGIIDDSDVFSIIVDPVKPQVVYASACSGIYKSLDGATEFRKVQGIPSTARRTRKLMQDPAHPQTVYAGTTEGLYRTLDGGDHWDRMTSGALIVNDVYVDPASPEHVLLATDRGGVMASDDGATSFHPSNGGFSARQITAYAADPGHPATIYVGVVNDKETGGVFQSMDGGLRWQQQSTGLGGRDVFSLGTTDDGTLLAGTNHGIFRLEADTWSDSSGLLHAAAAVPVAPAKAAAVQSHAPARKKARAGSAKTKAKPKAPASKTQPKRPPVAVAQARMDTLIFSIAKAGPWIYAGTTDGLMRGDAQGQNWTPTSLAMPEVRFLAVQDTTIVAAGLKRIMLSASGGEEWVSVPLPEGLSQIAAIAMDGTKAIWVGGREGLFYTEDAGLSWHPLPDLYVRQVDGIFFDTAGQRMLVTTSESSIVFSAHLPDRKVTYWDTGWKLRFARPVGDHLVGATLYDGLVIQPQMVDSSVAAAQAAGLSGTVPGTVSTAVSKTMEKSAAQ